MTVDQAVELSRTALLLALIIGAPMLLTAVAVGLSISVLQAVTQIQDQTISFVPKIVAILAILLYMLPWMMDRMIQYSTDLIHGIPSTF